MKLEDISFKLGSTYLRTNAPLGTKSYTYAEYSLAQPELIQSCQFDLDILQAKENDGFRKLRRIVMPPKYFETQYYREYSVSEDGDDDVVVRSDRVTLVNLASARHIFPELDVFLYVCPQELTWFLKNHAFANSSDIKSIRDSKDPLFLRMSQEFQLAADSLIDIRDVQLFSVTYRVKDAKYVASGTGIEYMSSKFNMSLTDLSPTQVSRILMRANEEFGHLTRAMNSRKFTLQVSKFRDYLEKSKFLDMMDVDSFAVNHLKRLPIKTTEKLLALLASRELNRYGYASPVTSTKTKLILPETVQIGDIITSGYMTRHQKTANIAAFQSGRKATKLFKN